MEVDTESAKAFIEQLEKAVNELEKAVGIFNKGSLAERINGITERINKLVDPKGRIVLQVCNSDALIFRPENKYEPFVVAYNYDPKSGEWSHGYYTRNIILALEKISPNIIDGSSIIWSREDIKSRLKLFSITPTQNNIKMTIDSFRHKPLNKQLRESGIEAGYAVMDDTIKAIIEEGQYE